MNAISEDHARMSKDSYTKQYSLQKLLLSSACLLLFIASVYGYTVAN